MRIRRLGWAGVEIECDGEMLVVDYVQDLEPLAPVLRSTEEFFPACSRPGETAAALLTHLHADHADADALSSALRHGAPIWRPTKVTGSADDVELTSFAEKKFARQKLAVEICGAWEERKAGPFRMSSVPAVDGFGDPQISWVIECGGHRVFHAGDTLFHGYWWQIAHRHGPFDIAFLPINAPICIWPHLQPPSPIEATLTPEQAAAAAHMIGAKAVVPIHFGALNKEPMYVETPHAVERLEQRGKELNLRIMPVFPGEWVGLS